MRVILGTIICNDWIFFVSMFATAVSFTCTVNKQERQFEQPVKSLSRAKDKLESEQFIISTAVGIKMTSMNSFAYSHANS